MLDEVELLVARLDDEVVARYRRVTSGEAHGAAEVAELAASLAEKSAEMTASLLGRAPALGSDRAVPHRS